MSDVSRETKLIAAHSGAEPDRALPAMPPAVKAVYSPEQQRQLARYAELLATQGVLRGLIGPREPARLWERHILNCAVLADAIQRDASVGDLGSGAGLPGLVVALVRPDVQVALVEPMQRRVQFLDDVVTTLGCRNVEIVRSRAETLHGQRAFDVVTSRALAPLPRLIAWSMPLVMPEGSLMALKGASVRDEVARMIAGWPSALKIPKIVELGNPALDIHTLAVRVAWANPAQVGWPTKAEPTVSIADTPGG